MSTRRPASSPPSASTHLALQVGPPNGGQPNDEDAEALVEELGVVVVRVEPIPAAQRTPHVWRAAASANGGVSMAPPAGLAAK
eukprot:2738599-Pyramimonas_sp.AAC.1